jgi:hypothetical protein
MYCTLNVPTVSKASSDTDVHMAGRSGLMRQVPTTPGTVS